MPTTLADHQVDRLLALFHDEHTLTSAMQIDRLDGWANPTESMTTSTLTLCWQGETLTNRAA